MPLHFVQNQMVACHSSIRRKYLRIEVESYEDLVQSLKRIETKFGAGYFDRVEFTSHGDPGIIHFKGGQTIKLQDLEKLRKANLDITSEGAELRFLCCSLGCDLKKNQVGSEFVGEFSSILLSRGGKAFAATRDLNIVSTETSYVR